MEEAASHAGAGDRNRTRKVVPLPLTLAIRHHPGACAIKEMSIFENGQITDMHEAECHGLGKSELLRE